MGFFDSIKESFANHFEKQKLDREMMEKLRREAEMQRQLAFEEQFKIDAKEVAIAKAKRDSAKLSGLQKLRAENRVRNLEKSNSSEGSAMQKFQAYTQKNIANRERNLATTQIIKDTAQQLKQSPTNPQTLNTTPIRREVRKPFSGGGFR